MALTNITNIPDSEKQLDTSLDTVGENVNELVTVEWFESTPYFNDRLVEYPNRYEETEDINDPSRVLHELDEGIVFQEGTPLSARVMNNLVRGIWTALMLGYSNMRKITELETRLSALDGQNKNGFSLFITDGDFEIIEGYYNEAEQRVECEA